MNKTESNLCDTAKQLTIAEFILKHGLEMQNQRTTHNTSMQSDDWSKTASHWLCTVRRFNRSDKRQFEITYSMGSAHKGAPKLEAVLDCVAIDASVLDQSFEDWAGDLGYDVDSRRAYMTWEACRDNAFKLRAFLGSAAFDELLACERL